MPKDPMTTGCVPDLKIAEARRAKGWKQEDLAVRIGVTQQAVQRYETGKRDVKASMLVRLSEALEVSVAYLLGMEDAEGFDSKMVSVPLFGSIAAGVPVDMEAADERYDLPGVVCQRWPKAFLLRVEGESMNRILPNGCYALIDPCVDVEYDGQPYAVCVNDLAATIKRVRRTGGGFELVPDSTDPSFRPQVLVEGVGGVGTVSVIGRVVWHCIPYDWTY